MVIWRRNRRTILMTKFASFANDVVKRYNRLLMILRVDKKWRVFA
jgi:hypothetical protein